jgi:hypothetical protein
LPTRIGRYVPSGRRPGMLPIACKNKLRLFQVQPKFVVTLLKKLYMSPTIVFTFVCQTRLHARKTGLID